MTTETTLVVHWDRPEGGGKVVFAKHKEDIYPSTWHIGTVCADWEKFEWWSEIPAPVKPKRFVVKRGIDGVWFVIDMKRLRGNNIVADHIQSEEAAQRIADIYEETTP